MMIALANNVTCSKSSRTIKRNLCIATAHCLQNDGFDTKSLGIADENKSAVRNDSTQSHTRILFQNLSFQVESGEIYLMGGPSGRGKAQLLRSIAMLSSLNAGKLQLDGTQRQSFSYPSEWRKRVRYVTQYKVDIPRSP
jgi:ABC-type multidrug transport system ATPase subunit